MVGASWIGVPPVNIRCLMSCSELGSPVRKHVIQITPLVVINKGGILYETCALEPIVKTTDTKFGKHRVCIKMIQGLE
jgi:hypothetical protein